MAQLSKVKLSPKSENILVLDSPVNSSLIILHLKV